MFQGKHEFDPETEEALLLGEDFDEEEEEDERSWKRQSWTSPQRKKIKTNNNIRVIVKQPLVFTLSHFAEQLFLRAKLSALYCNNTCNVMGKSKQSVFRFLLSLTVYCNINCCYFIVSYVEQLNSCEVLSMKEKVNSRDS